jgi:hypothetical protein
VEQRRPVGPDRWTGPGMSRPNETCLDERPGASIIVTFIYRPWALGSDPLSFTLGRLGPGLGSATAPPFVVFVWMILVI